MTNVHDAHLHPLITEFVETMMVLTGTGVHATTGDAANAKGCHREAWNGRMLAETIFSLLTTVFDCTKVRPRVCEDLRARVAWTMAAFTLLEQ